MYYRSLFPGFLEVVYIFAYIMSVEQEIANLVGGDGNALLR